MFRFLSQAQFGLLDAKAWLQDICNCIYIYIYYKIMYVGTYSKVGTTNTAACSQVHLAGRLYFIPSFVTAWVKGWKGVAECQSAIFQPCCVQEHTTLMSEINSDAQVQDRSCGKWSILSSPIHLSPVPPSMYYLELRNCSLRPTPPHLEA